jgi:hypothetical protein
MTKEELIEEFITVHRLEDRIEIWVETIGWNGPHTPVPDQELGNTLKAESSESEVVEAIAVLLKNPDFFGLCKECEEYNPAGWMVYDDVCQSCGTENHGIVY